MTKLSDEQKRRYARHIVLPEIGEAGQAKLLDTHVAIIGAGGLGSNAAGFLAAMGVGKLTLIDHDRVELSNLQRQILFEAADIGQPKVRAAAERLTELNADVQLITHAEKITENNATQLLSGADIILDGSDNFATRITIHRAAYELNTPLVYAAISGFEAMITTFKAHLGALHPCLHCFMPEPPTREISCAQEGIIGALAGMIGSMQALEAVKELLGIGESLSGRLMRYDAMSGKWRNSELSKDISCGFCSHELTKN